ncbi:lytic murein transglycosylase B [Pseudomonas sp. NCCP-436]|uniref:lytic murein transglycosylase B n=1 Tax=Pseudomonas sp. NCCP-436 TaxID=2842481 RepID=UPI001C811163|nr:lytic murein transglycosylase B [Pseudomonas sp. NCCP-436]GIZ12392.1 murein transglycosylase [Pseudomonas sp. NCCP-436]
MHALRSWAARTLLGIGLAGALGTAAQAVAADYQGAPQVAEFIDELTRDYGFASEQLQGLFAEVERKQAILDAISRPAEKVKPWKDYRPIFITDKRISQGVEFWSRNQAALEKAEAEYGVAPQFIVAIIGVETFYGGNTGSWRVMDALSTLAFDYPPRAPFFRKELREFLLLAREEQVDPLSLKGSYAGAMGLPQFMPSSFRAYAVDFDGDGRINIWSNPTDAIGSVASYFKRHGWQAGGQVASRAEVSGERVDEGLTQGLDPVKSVAELRELGWRSADVLADETPVTAFRLEGAEGDEYWFGLPNFFTITRYNRSVMYAMAVNQLAEALVEARGKQ